MDLHIGERVGLQCVISKGDAPLNIRWLKDNQELASYGSDGGLLLRSFDQFTSVLTIERLARDHGGNYTCIARNAAASAQYTAQLQVNGIFLHCPLLTGVAYCYSAAGNFAVRVRRVVRGREGACHLYRETRGSALSHQLAQGCSSHDPA